MATTRTNAPVFSIPVKIFLFQRHQRIHSSDVICRYGLFLAVACWGLPCSFQKPYENDSKMAPAGMTYQFFSATVAQVFNHSFVVHCSKLKNIWLQNGVNQKNVFDITSFRTCDIQLSQFDVSEIF